MSLQTRTVLHLFSTFFATFTFFSVSSATAAQGIVHPPINGIYLIATARRVIGVDKNLNTALTNPYVDGAYISLNWDKIEPQRGQYDWTALDSEVALVSAAHKKVSLAVVPGSNAPAWVYQAGAKPFNTVVEPLFAADLCAPLKLPIPWDATYLSIWTEFVRAFGARYAHNPAVSFIKVTGVSYRTDETSLPFGTYARLPPDRTVVSPRTGLRCLIPDDLQQWQADGYTWAKVDGAFEQIVSAYESAFPGIPLGIMTSDHSFPPLSSDGLYSDNAGYALSTTDFFAIGRRLLGERFVGQCNCLTAKQTNAGVDAFSSTNPIGYQTGMPTHNELFCIMNGRERPCDEMQVFEAVVDRALGAHANYIEMFYDDINYAGFQEILQRAHQRLNGRS